MQYQAEGTPLMIFAGEEYAPAPAATGRQGYPAARRQGRGGRRASERIHRATWPAWACCRCSSRTAWMPPAWA
jgi:hypothetical protein